MELYSQLQVKKEQSSVFTTPNQAIYCKNSGEEAIKLSYTPLQLMSKQNGSDVPQIKELYISSQSKSLVFQEKTSMIPKKNEKLKLAIRPKTINTCSNL